MNSRSNNPAKEKSYDFALKIIQLYQDLVRDRKEFVLSRQILKSGTSIGANIEEAIGGQSRRDFFAKISIAYKEARETHYWLRLLRDSNMISSKEAEQYIVENEELLKLIGSIKKTTENILNS